MLFAYLRTYAFLAMLSRPLACPEGFDQLNNGVCVVQKPATAEFCEANARCSDHTKSNGQLVFLIGEQANQLGARMRYPDAWTSINQLFNFRGTSPDGWVDGDPQFVDGALSATINNWENGIPSGDFPVAIYRSISKSFSDVHMVQMVDQYAVFCEYVGEVELTPARSMFKVKKQSLGFTNQRPLFDGCHSVQTGVLSTQECALRQVRLPNDQIK